MKQSVSKRPLQTLALEGEALREMLCAEFTRLNEAHFGNQLAMPEIIISHRKTYGGYYQPQNHRIVVSWQAYQEHGLPETLNTFRHEVAHIVHPNHSAAFWQLAYSLGVTRRYAATPISRPERRYVYSCAACGRQIERRRLLRAASCAACDTRYNPRFALHLVSS